MSQIKYLFHYKKVGMLRYLSHLETMKMIDRLLRRTGIELKQTEGFHQRTKISFAQAVPTGIIDLAGLFLVTTFEEIDGEYVKRANALAPKGLEIVKVEKEDERFKLSKFIKGYEFMLIFLNEPQKLPFSVEKKNEIWIARIFRPFNSSVPKNGEYGQFLTIRSKFVGGAN
jgi:radical SAM-linked protein